MWMWSVPLPVPLQELLDWGLLRGGGVGGIVSFSGIFRPKELWLFRRLLGGGVGGTVPVPVPLLQTELREQDLSLARVLVGGVGGTSDSTAGSSSSSFSLWITMTSYRLSLIFLCFLYLLFSFSKAVLNRFLLLLLLTTSIFVTWYSSWLSLLVPIW